MGKLAKISAWEPTKVKSKKQVIDEARTSGATVHSALLMDICHLKNAELEAKHQKYKGRVVLRGCIVKDDSGSYAVFTEQGSSASQMKAAKVMDIISRLAGCAGQAADAVSAYTQVKTEDASTLLRIPESECPDIWIRLPRHKWPKSWSSMEDPVVPLEREEFISSTRKTRNSKKPSRMLARNWKHQWKLLLLCPAKLLRTIRIVGVVHPTKQKQDLRVFWKLMNLRDCVWELLYRIIMKTILQEKVRIHCSITIWCTNLFLCLKP